VRAQRRTRRGAAEEQCQRAEREWKMTGAKHECPYHPRHAAIFQMPGIGQLAGLHYALLRFITTKPTAIAATTPKQIATIGSMVFSLR
jgi:hypothetical protein